VRVLDAGGWTDTWFARRGAVCHLAVDDGVHVSARRYPPSGSAKLPTAELHVPDFGERYSYLIDEPPGRHPMLEAALRRFAPPSCSVEVTVSSSVPPGSGLGTSAAVLVALIASLTALAGEGADDGAGDVAAGDPAASVSDPQALARAAHHMETVDLALESGVQDHVAAAFGGSNFLTIDSYPDVDVHRLDLAPSTWEALTRRIVTVYLGRPHHSSSVHKAVIERLVATDGETRLARLRVAAHDAATALVEGNLDAYGQALIANTQAQSALHPALVNPVAREVIRVAAGRGALGWKVNGAGGAGGTVSILGPEPPDQVATGISSIAGLTLLPLRPAREGVRVVDRD
jgi:D-glycero-alpha-D-manno-heptose-7-phosphate kinase